VGEDQEHHFPLLCPVAACVDHIAEASFDHADNGFHLPALTILFAGETELHLTAVLLGGLLGRRSSAFGRDDTFDLILVSSALVVAFAVISGIRQNRDQLEPVGHPLKEWTELIDIDAGPPCCHGSEDQMRAAFADDRQFGKPPVAGVFDVFELFGAFSANEVPADVPGLQAGGIDGRQRHFFLLQDGLHGLEQQLIGHRQPQQFGSRFLEGCKVRNLPEMDLPAQLRTVF
jgi:hypothetical protein